MSERLSSNFLDISSYILQVHPNFVPNAGDALVRVVADLLLDGLLDPGVMTRLVRGVAALLRPPFF